MTPAKLIDREIALIATSHCPLSQASFCRGLVVMASTAKKISFTRRAELERQIDQIDRQHMSDVFAAVGLQLPPTTKSSTAKTAAPALEA
ncbi:MAG: hypothetical protein ACRES0_25185, partial [Pseudomonas sp.]